MIMTGPVSHKPYLPLGFARRAGVAVLDEQAADGALRLAVRPGSSEQSWREARRALGRPLKIEPVSDSDFLNLLETLYGTDRAGEGDEALAIELEIDDGLGRASVTDLLDDAGEAPVIQLINTLLRRALQAHASDMHVEPMDEGLRVRMRIDGVLRTVMERRDAPSNMVVSRFKVMAGLDIAETRLPQDGRIALSFGGRTVDVRISTLPSKFGERVVLRLLDKSAGLLSLGEIGLSADQRARIDRMIAHPNGIVLVTGPTGSGKTTTLYSIIRTLNDTARNILTVEDPVEYDLDGIGQTQVNAAIGMTFAQSLRAILRQDPDIVLVGEIRDGETASIAVQAALTGHLVLSTLHTNTALGAVTRLRDLGVEPYLLSSTLRGLVAQRLVRRLCRACKSWHPAHGADGELFSRHGLAVPDRLPRAEGCDVCDHTGFKGRFGVYEIIEVTGTLRDLIHDDAGERALNDKGLLPADTLLASGLRAVAQGETSLDEAMRVIAEQQ